MGAMSASQGNGGAGAGARRVMDAGVRPVAAIAGSQPGLITHDQLLASGLTRDTIVHWRRRGWLHMVHRGVYALGHTALPPLGRETAALLACGADAVLSHSSAASTWGFHAAP